MKLCKNLNCPLKIAIRILTLNLIWNECYWHPNFKNPYGLKLFFKELIILQRCIFKRKYCNSFQNREQCVDICSDAALHLAWVKLFTKYMISPTPNSETPIPIFFSTNHYFVERKKETTFVKPKRNQIGKNDWLYDLLMRPIEYNFYGSL